MKIAIFALFCAAIIAISQPMPQSSDVVPPAATPAETPAPTDKDGVNPASVNADLREMRSLSLTILPSEDILKKLKDIFDSPFCYILLKSGGK